MASRRGSDAATRRAVEALTESYGPPEACLRLAGRARQEPDEEPSGSPEGAAVPAAGGASYCTASDRPRSSRRTASTPRQSTTPRASHGSARCTSNSVVKKAGAMIEAMVKEYWNTA